MELILTVVTLAVAAAIYVAWSRTRKPALTPGVKTDNSAAYDASMRGKVNVSSENPTNNESAIKLFQQAIAAHPNFAATYAELAGAYSIKARYCSPVAGEPKSNQNA